MLEFLGRTHILILHLPIGILLLIAVLEIICSFSKLEISKEVLRLMYFTGAVTAIFACISGYILATGYDHSWEETRNHFWAGIATATLSALALALSFSQKQLLRKVCSISIAVSMAVTGHLGGSLTHGEGFLNPSTFAGAEAKPLAFDIEEVSEAVVYTDIIHPIFENKCVSCHGPNKIKGKLRMDSPEELMKNGKSGKSLLTDDGEILRRVHLPESNDKHMPPKAKPQLTEEHLSIIEWWIENGASFDQKLTKLEGFEEILPIIEKAIEESAKPIDDRKNIPAVLPEVDLSVPDRNAIAILKKENIVVLPAGKDSRFVEVSYINQDTISPTHLDQLTLLKDHIYRLDLGRMSLTSEAVTLIGEMKHLTTLYLNETNLTDADLMQLKNLEHLHYLNISGTEVTNQGVQALDELQKLKDLYAYETTVTLDSLLSGVSIYSTRFTLPPLDSDTLRI